MIEGYWTALGCVLIFILLLTGWGSIINKHIRLLALLPAIVIIWGAGINQWELQLSYGPANLSINYSFIIIAPIIVMSLFLRTNQVKLGHILLYSLSVGMAYTMLRAFSIISPWNLSKLHMALIICCLLMVLRLNIAENVITVFWSSAITELLLMWQQRGDYNGDIGSLAWWDNMMIIFLIMTSAKMVAMYGYRICSLLARNAAKRMKS